MRNKIVITILIMFSGLLLVHFGCVKGNPIGADISSLANTTITVKVFDGTTAQQGITVQASDPSGANFLGLTDSNGTYVFQAKLAGRWLLTIPTQGNFFLSSANVDVVAGTNGPSISFTAQGQQLILAPLTPETYGVTGANITYQVTYSNSGNLAEPVSLIVVGPITQTGWTMNFNYSVLGSTTNISQFNVVIPQGSYQQPTFDIEAHRVGDGSLLTSTNVRAINRNFSVQSNFFVNVSPGAGGQNVTVTGNLTLSTTNAGDSNTNWLGSLSCQLLDIGANYASVTLGFASCPILNFNTPDGNFNGGGFYNLSAGSTISCGSIQTDSFQIQPGQIIPVTIVSNCGSGGSNLIYGGGRYTENYGRIQMMLRLTSAVATVSGGITFGYAADKIPVGTVFNLTD